VAAAPTPEELGPLLAETNSLDEPLGEDSYGDSGEFMAAARAAVGSDVKAAALKDAIAACLREHGLISGDTEGAEELGDELGGDELDEEL
jgi:hypothetical protein